MKSEKLDEQVQAGQVDLPDAFVDRWPSGQQRSIKPTVAYDGSIIAKRTEAGKGIYSNRDESGRPADLYREMPWNEVIDKLYPEPKKNERKERR